MTVERGAYVVQAGTNVQVLLLATGSEVAIALEAAEILAKEGVGAQVVSMPCWELFEQQDQSYRDAVLLPTVKARVGVEAGIRQGWERWLGDAGEFVGLSGFGASGPYKTLYKEYGLTAENVVQAAHKSLENVS